MPTAARRDQGHAQAHHGPEPDPGDVGQRHVSALTPASSPFPRVISEANAVRANSGSAFGEGDSFDGDGVGMNTSDEENYPYN